MSFVLQIIEDPAIQLSIVDEAGATLEVANEVTQVLQLVSEGPPGPRGEKGESGAVGADVTYLHNQSAPASTWVVAHNLGKYPATTLFDSTGAVVFGDVTYIDANNAIVNFSGAVSGKAAFN